MFFYESLNVFFYNTCSVTFSDHFLFLSILAYFSSMSYFASLIKLCSNDISPLIASILY